MKPEQAEPEYECRQCFGLFRMLFGEPAMDEDGRVFCSIYCQEEYEQRQGELQMDRKLS